jgi:hypothetical protein
MRHYWGLLVLSLAATCASAADRYLDLHQYVEPVAKLDGLRYVFADLRVKSSNPAVKPEAIALTIRASGGDIAVPVGADGRFSLPLDRALVEENPEVATNQPKDSLELAVSLDVRADPQQSFDYALLGEMAAEYDRVVAEQKLTWRLFAPGAKGLAIRFPKGSDATATVMLASGPVKYAANEKDELRLPDKSDWRRQNPRIALSTMPEKIALDFGR